MVKIVEHFENNRPVHLALRDVYYARAVELIKASEHAGPPAIADFERMLFMLRMARDHGSFAARAYKSEKDSQFCKFINMLAGNVKAVLSMLNLKHSVEAEGGFFFSFLEANHASVALQAEEYERRVRDIIRCMINTLELSDGAFDQLRQTNYAAFSPSERERYNKAAEHHRQLEGRPELPVYRKPSGRYD